MEQEQLGRVTSMRLVVAIASVSAVLAAGMLLVKPVDALTQCNDGTSTTQIDKRPCSGHGGVK